METLVGLAILSTMLIATYSGVSSALKTAIRVAERQAAVERVPQVVDQLRRQPFVRTQSLGGETDGYRWEVSVESAQGPVGRQIVPFRIVGSLVSKRAGGGLVTVVDTIMLGRGR